MPTGQMSYRMSVPYPLHDPNALWPGIPWILAMQPLFDEEEGGLTAYIGGSMGVNWVPEQPELGPMQTDEQNAIYAIGIDNPAQNLFSPTSISESQTLGQLVADTISSVVQGREDMSALDTMISDWQSRGGDTIRSEYEEAYAANQG